MSIKNHKNLNYDYVFYIFCVALSKQYKFYRNIPNSSNLLQSTENTTKKKMLKLQRIVFKRVAKSHLDELLPAATVNKMSLTFAIFLSNLVSFIFGWCFDQEPKMN